MAKNSITIKYVRLKGDLWATGYEWGWTTEHFKNELELKQTLSKQWLKNKTLDTVKFKKITTAELNGKKRYTFNR